MTFTGPVVPADTRPAPLGNISGPSAQVWWTEDRLELEVSAWPYDELADPINSLQVELKAVPLGGSGSRNDDWILLAMIGPADLDLEPDGRASITLDLDVKDAYGYRFRLTAIDDAQLRSMPVLYPTEGWLEVDDLPPDVSSTTIHVVPDPACPLPEGRLDDGADLELLDGATCLVTLVGAVDNASGVDQILYRTWLNGEVGGWVEAGPDGRVPIYLDPGYQGALRLEFQVVDRVGHRSASAWSGEITIDEPVAEESSWSGIEGPIGLIGSLFLAVIIALGVVRFLGLDQKAGSGRPPEKEKGAERPDAYKVEKIAGKPVNLLKPNKHSHRNRSTDSQQDNQPANPGKGKERRLIRTPEPRGPAPALPSFHQPHRSVPTPLRSWAPPFVPAPITAPPPQARRPRLGKRSLPTRFFTVVDDSDLDLVGEVARRRGMKTLPDPRQLTSLPEFKE
jgi:hypothetical protein